LAAIVDRQPILWPYSRDLKDIQGCCHGLQFGCYTVCKCCKSILANPLLILKMSQVFFCDPAEAKVQTWWTWFKPGVSLAVLSLVDGFKHVLLSISYMGRHPSH